MFTTLVKPFGRHTTGVYPIAELDAQSGHVALPLLYVG